MTTSAAELGFRACGPFDAEERAVIGEAVAAVRQSEHPTVNQLVEAVEHHLEQIHQLAAVLQAYPSLFAPQSLGRRERSQRTLVTLLCHSNLSNFDMFLPTRALLSRTLAMAEVNFYRMLRFVCDEALPSPQALDQRARIEGLLCECLYARLVDEVFKHIASDESVNYVIRERAAIALSHIWEHPTYRVKDFFPVLEATWEARRRVAITLGTLMGTSEMFRLLTAGCDPQFVDYLVKPGHTQNEGMAFREFLFGSTTEQLDRIEQEMVRRGKSSITRADLEDIQLTPDLSSSDSDPAIVLYEFFLSRHLQAAARRLNDLPGPKRTAEEYVMLRYLEHWSPDSMLLEHVEPAEPAEP